MGNEQAKEAELIFQTRTLSVMDEETKQKLANKSVKYNMKVIIRGDKCTGKTSLWRRLQQLPFIEEHITTPHIQIANIHRAYKATDEIVKVELWDIVDKAKRQKKKPSEGIKINHEEEEEEEEEEIVIPSPGQIDPTTLQNKGGSFIVQYLDASMIDVYKGTHAVILVFDPIKKWTYEYAQQEIDQIPNNIQILLLANFRDKGDYRVVTEKEVRAFIESKNKSNLHYLEVSLKLRFGLDRIIGFFDIPFLILQKAQLELQIQQNQQELEIAQQELNLEHSYQDFLQQMEARKKGKKLTTPKANPLSSAQTSLTSSTRNSPSIQPDETPSSEQREIPKESVKPEKELKTQSKALSSPTLVVSSPKSTEKTSTETVPQASQKSLEKKESKTGFFSRLISRGSVSEGSQSKSQKIVEDDLKTLAVTKAKPANLEDFKIGGDVEGFFADEEGDSRSKAKTIDQQVSEESDEEVGNSMVAKDEDLDSEEEKPKPPIKSQINKKTETTDLKPKSPPVQTPIKLSEPPKQSKETPKSSTSPAQKKSSSKQVATKKEESEESDDDKPNPLVQQDAEEFESFDIKIPKQTSSKKESINSAQQKLIQAQESTKKNLSNPSEGKNKENSKETYKPPSIVAKNEDTLAKRVSSVKNYEKDINFTSIEHDEESDDKTNPLITKHEEESDDKSNPLVTKTEDYNPNPIVTKTEDFEDYNSNPIVTKTEDFEDYNPNPIVTKTEDFEDYNPNPIVTKTEDFEDYNPNPIVTKTEDFEDYNPNPIVTKTEDFEDYNPNPIVPRAEEEEKKKKVRKTKKTSDGTKRKVKKKKKESQVREDYEDLE